MSYDTISKETVVVVSLSVGTMVMFCACCLAVCLVVAFSGAANVVTHHVDHKATPVRDLLKPSSRPKGAIEDIGPLNTKALNEEKNGIFSRIANRIYCRRNCVPCQPCQPDLQPIQPSPQPSPQPVRPHDPDFIQPNYSVVPPIPKYPECVDCQQGVKTGGFVCTCCKKPTVGQEWHTEWQDDGPVTYLCEKCWAKTTEQQKSEFLKKWSESN